MTIPSDPPAPAEPAGDLPPATTPTPRRTRRTAPRPPAAPAVGDPLEVAVEGAAAPAAKAPAAKVATTRAPVRKAPAAKAATTRAPAAKAPAAKATAAKAPAAPAPAGPVTLCVDVGGSGVKGTAVGPDGAMLGERVKIATTYPLKPADLVDMIAEIARRSPTADRVSIGFPGMVRAGRVLSAPHFVTKKGPGSKVDADLVVAWTDFTLADAVDRRLGLPTRLANDADTQGLAAIQGGGLELVITLGTGIGTAVFLDGELQAHVELSHHPLTKAQTYNQYVGDAALRKIGKKKWSKRVDETVTVLKALTFYDRLYVGGGNAEQLTKAFGHDATVVPNTDGIVGGLKLWSMHRVP